MKTTDTSRGLGADAERQPTGNKVTRFLRQAWLLYYDGFREMTLGKTLWLIIAVKLAVMFLVLKLFFFPNYIKEHAEKGQEAEFVFQSITPENTNP